MNAPANLPAEQSAHPIEVIKSIVARKANDFKMVLPSHISVDKFQRTIATAALSNPTLLGCDRQSLLIAAMKLAQDGLLPDGREAALVPFKSWNKETHETVWQVQAMPMAWGLRKKILQSGQVVSLETGLVYRAELESGHFLYEIGIDPPIRHRPKLDLTTEETADTEIVAAYSIARIKAEGGDPYWSVEVMRRSEIDKVRQASQTGALGRVVKGGQNAGKPITPKGPWVDWYGEMARKTVLRRHSKVLPMSGDLFETIERDTEEELRAAGAARLLAEKVDAPVALPTNDQLDAQNDDHDPETGEVRDSRGLTETDEETARALDAGPAAEDEAETEQADEAEQSNADPHTGKPYADKRRHVLEAIAGAKDHAQLLDAQRVAKKYVKALPDDVKAEINAAYAAALEQHPAPEAKAEDAGEAEPSDDDKPAWAEPVAAVRAKIEAATDRASWSAADTAFQRIMAGLPDDVRDELDDELLAKRRALSGETGK